MRNFAGILARKWGESGRGFNVMTVLIFVVIAAAVIPVAITQITGADTSGWPSAAVTLWDLLPTFIVIGVVLAVVGFAVAKKTGRI